MKFKNKFILREIMGEYILVPIGDSTNRFNGLVTINELGKFIWENFEKVEDKEELLNKILEEYEVEREVAKRDLDEFLQKMENIELISKTY